MSDLNPFLRPLEQMADLAKANRAQRDNGGTCALTERWAAAMISASWDLYRDLRDAGVESTFFHAYGPASLLRLPRRSAEEAVEARSVPRVKEALAYR